MIIVSRKSLLRLTGIYFCLLVIFIIFGCIPNSYQYTPSPPFSPGDLVLAEYLVNVWRVGEVISCTTTNVSIELLRNGHEFRAPSISRAPETVFPLPPSTESERTYWIESLRSWYYSVDLYTAPYIRSFDGLGEFLLDFIQLYPNYRRDVYDCSQAAAYLESSLEDAGFDAWICVGPAPFDPSEYHAWNFVYIPDYSSANYVVAIEPTVFFPNLQYIWNRIKYFFTGRYPGIVYSDDKYSEGYYYGYDLKYFDIYSVLALWRGDINEWNWWFILQD